MGSKNRLEDGREVVGCADAASHSLLLKVLENPLQSSSLSGKLE